MPLREDAVATLHLRALYPLWNRSQPTTALPKKCNAPVANSPPLVRYGQTKVVARIGKRGKHFFKFYGATKAVNWIRFQRYTHGMACTLPQVTPACWARQATLHHW